MTGSGRAFWIAALPLIAAVAVQRPALAQPSQQPSAAALQATRAACETDLQRFCAGVQPGGGRILACLKEHRDQVSAGCRQAVISALQGQGQDPTPAGAPPAAADAARPGAGNEATPAPQAAAAKAAASASPHAGAQAQAASAGYARLKVAKAIVKNDQNQDTTAFTLLIPADWQFNGAKSLYSGGGCFADFIQVNGVAKTGDEAYGIALMPQSTFQYADDPGLRKQMEQRNRLDEQFKIKACPIAAPMRAADFLRENMVWHFHKDKPQVTAEPFPELEQVARRQLGLGPQGQAAGGASPRVEAARVRTSTTNSKGDPVDEWWSAVVVVRTVPAAGQGAAYDWHAEQISVFQAPRGQLDGYDKLYKLMATSVRPDPQFQAWSNRQINTLYRARAVETAKQSKMVADFQRHVVETINEVQANRERGAAQAAYGQDQLIRGVQTFRDPGTGRTVELSNLYDHAWQNGTDQYIMSDDPNFNPNGRLNGDWSELQPVRPQP